MACNNYENCYKKELDNMAFPMDKESLYAERIYDSQTARNRCYDQNPIKIVEGFNGSWNIIIKLLIVLLLLYLVYELSKGYNSEQVGGFIDSVSQFNISEYKL